MIKNFLFVFALISSARALAASCSANSDLNNIQKMAAETLRDLNIQQIDDNMTEFCRRAVLDRFLRANNSDLPNCDSKPLAELDEEIFSLAKSMAESSWSLSLLPSKIARKESMKLNFHKSIEAETVTETERQMIILNSATSFGPDDFKLIISKDDIPGAYYKQSILERAKDKVIKVSVCGRSGAKSALSCQKALDYVQDNFTPNDVKSVKFVDINSWRELLTNEKYNKGLELAARKLINIAQSEDATNSNIYDDLTNSFRDGGLSRKDASDAALLVLGCLSSGAAHTDLRMEALYGSNFIKYKKPLSLSIIAKNLNLIDEIQVLNNKPLYSFPSNAQGSCDTGKSYHFWMSAHITNELIKNGFAADTAAHAAYIAHVGYQANRSLGYSAESEVGSLERILAHHPLSPMSNVIRLDLSFAAAGAAFTAAKSHGRENAKIDIKSIAKSLFRSADLSTNLSLTDATLLMAEQGRLAGYNKFLDTYAPFEGIKTALSQ